MKTEKKRSFRGAVLLTVVSVMSLLIVFLTSTLVLATAANNRAHKSYSSSQASYTARAAIDSILAAAKQNEDFAIAMNSLKDGESFDVDVNMESSATGIGKVDSAKIAYAGKKQFYDASKQEWVERTLVSITADVTSGGETKTVTAYALHDCPKPSVDNIDGGFKNVGSASTSNHTIAYGGTYLGIGMSAGQRYYQGDYHLPGGQIVSLNDKLYLNRKDDQPGAIGDLGDGTIGYLPNMPETSDADQIVTYSFGNEGCLEAPVVINGNLYANTKTEIYFPDISTGLSVWGNMKFQNPSNFTLSANPNLYYYKTTDYIMAPNSLKNVPYIYVDSLFESNTSSLNFNADGAFPLNMFCGSVNLRNVSIGADIYCQDSNKTSVLSGDANTSLYKWSDSVINKSSYLDSTMSGNFYSKGSAIVKDTNNWVTINGDMVIEGDLEVTGKLKVTGSLVVGGTLKCDGELDVAGSIAADSATGSRITANVGDKKMRADGTGELYERHDEEFTAVLAQNVRLRKGPNPWDIDNRQFVWLKHEAIDAFGMPDSDGDGIIDGNVYDFHWGEVDNETYYYADEWDVGYEPWKPKKPDTVEPEKYTKTTWVNTEDGTTTENENDTFEVNGYTYNGSKTVDPTSLYKAMHNNELFPRKAEKAVILGLEEIGDGTPMAESKVLKTVYEIEDENNLATRSITEIPSAGNYLADVNANVYTNGTLPAEITTSCTLSGSFDRDIIIKNTSTNDIWIKFDNFVLQNNGDIIYDDTLTNCGNLNFFVENTANFLTGRSIYTKTYKELIDNHTTFQIATNKKLYVDDATGGEKAKRPKINIYSKKIEYNADGSVKSQPYFNMSNGASIVTACVLAPNMKFNITNAKNLSGNDIYYDGRRIAESPGYNGGIGVIGDLTVAEGDMQNNWIFLYVKDLDLSGSEDNTGEVSKEFDVMYYEGF